MKDKLSVITVSRYCELMVEQILSLLYEKGLMNKEELSKMNDVIAEIMEEELQEALNDSRK